MAQLTEFPILPPGDYRTAVSTFIRVLKLLPADGEPAKTFRQRLKAAELWSRERHAALLRFLRLADSDPVLPSPLLAALAAAPTEEAARDVLADRLWDANPLLFKTVVDLLTERVHSPNEILKYLESYAYPGVRITGPQVNHWIHLAQGLELLKTVGIRLGLAPRGEKYKAKATGLDVDEFLEEDPEEPAPPIPAQAALAALPGVAAPTPIASAQPAIPAPPPVVVAPAPATRPAVVRPKSRYTNPRGEGSTFALTSASPLAPLAPEALRFTAERLAAWWRRQEVAEAPLDLESLALTGERWSEDMAETLYRLALLAALLERPDRGPNEARAAYEQLDRSGALGALFEGTAPDDALEGLDSKALLLASLVARRLAEHPDLPGELESAGSGEVALAKLEATLGRGLLGRSLPWLLGALGAVGVLRPSEAPALGALPTRALRDTLFRLGFTTTPYASTPLEVLEAIRAAGQAAGPARPDECLLAFAEAAGCAYDCPHRRSCEFPCRERTERP